METIETLKKQIEELQAEILELKVQVNRAKDISPVERPSFRRVAKLASNACVSMKKLSTGWLLSMGKLQRKFKSLKQIWLLLTQENWCLSDIFPPQNKPLEFRDAAPRLPKRYPALTVQVGGKEYEKECLDWQTWRPPPKEDELPEYPYSSHLEGYDLPFGWT